METNKALSTVYVDYFYAFENNVLNLIALNGQKSILYYFKGKFNC